MGSGEYNVSNLELDESVQRGGDGSVRGKGNNISRIELTVKTNC